MSVVTGFDAIASHMINKGYSVSPIKNDGGHYLPSAIISSVNNMTISQKSKTCKIQGYVSDIDGDTPAKLTIGNLVIDLPMGSNTIEGDFYVDVNGNLSLS